MRRLIVEFYVNEIAKYIDYINLDKLESMEVLNFLNEFTLICRVRFKGRSTRISDVIKRADAEVRVISREEDGSYIVYFESKAVESPGPMFSGGYFVTPYKIRDGKAKLTFLGQPAQVRAFLRTMQMAGIDYKVDLLTDANFSPSSPIGRLTEKQRKVLIMAYNLGYYDIPRRIDTDELAQKLKITNPAFVMHRRKAEKAILKELLSDA